jgi:hypothetical protein
VQAIPRCGQAADAKDETARGDLRGEGNFYLRMPLWPYARCVLPTVVRKEHRSINGQRGWIALYTDGHAERDEGGGREGGREGGVWLKCGQVSRERRRDARVFLVPMYTSLLRLHPPCLCDRTHTVQHRVAPME